MLIIHGTYQLARKRVAVRNDFCNSCERVCLSEQWRSFDFGHLYWIPLMPLGSRKHWICLLCNQDPRARYKTKRGFKIAGLIVTFLFAALFFSASPSPDDKEMTPTLVWSCRLGATAAFLGFAYSVFKRVPETSEDERRACVVPLSVDSCVYCGGRLKHDTVIYCPGCDVQINTG